MRIRNTFYYLLMVFPNVGGQVVSPNAFKRKRSIDTVTTSPHVHDAFIEIGSSLVEPYWRLTFVEIC